MAPTKTTSPKGIPNNLPIALSSFVGREVELSRLTGLLQTQPASGRLLTLVGPGGVGKTRLALQTARALVTSAGAAAPEPTTHVFADGIWLVELASLENPHLVPAAVALAIGAREQPGQSAVSTLVAAIGVSRSLIVLDNCEHLVEACARLVVTLLERCPGLGILATSRETLGVPGEVTWPVSPLALPDARPSASEAADPGANESVRLFVDRASLVQPDFALTTANAPIVAEICRQLDGIPLAIELAAARVNAFDLQTIAEGLADRFRFLTGDNRTALPRHQTLRALVEWSYDLLSPDEQRLFTRLAVFVGGWDQAAVEPVIRFDWAVARDEGDPAFDLLARLVDKSLIIRVPGKTGRTRYRIIETLRQYALHRLEAGGERPAIRERHARYYLGRLEAAERQIEGPDQPRWLDRIEEELDNLRAALDWCSEVDEAAAGFRVAWALALLGWLRGYLNEVDARLAALLAIPSSARAPDELRAKALVSAGYIAWCRREVAVAQRRLEEGLEIFRRVDRPDGAGQALTWLGLVVTGQGHYELARSLYEEARGIFQQTGDAFWSARAATHLGRCLNLMGKYAEATAYLDEALAIRRALGDARGVANTLIHIMDGMEARGEREGVNALLDEAMSIAQSIGDRFVSLLALVRLGRQEYAAGKLLLAQRHLHEALVVAQHGGFAHEIAEVTLLLNLVAGALASNPRQAP